MTMTQLLEKRRERKALVDQAQAIRDLAVKENRKPTAEEDAKFDRIMNDVDTMLKDIEREERLLAVHEQANIEGEGLRHVETPEGNPKDAEEKRYAGAFYRWLRFGMEKLKPEERSLMDKHFIEQRDFAVGTGNVGGFTVPQDFYNQLEKALKFFGGMIASAGIIRTGSGADLPMPTLNDTATAGELLTEGTAAAADTSTPFGQVIMKAYMWSSKILPVSLQYLQDSAFDESIIVNMLADRLGRVLNTYFTTGTGTAQPQGVVTGATLGKTGTTGQTLTVIFDDLVDLVYSIDAAYRQLGNCKWMMNDASIKVVRKLKDTQGRPLWEPSLQLGQPDMLLSYPIVPNNDVAVMAANAKSILFGDFSKYKVRLVTDVQMLRLVERYAEKLQVGFLGFIRADGRMLDAGTNPIKYYANSAT